MTRKRKQVEEIVDPYDVDSHAGPEDFVGGSVEFGGLTFDDTDLFLIALLKDAVLCPEFCFSNPNNTEYGGTYRVRDYQVKFNRADDHYAGFSCARSVGKTEREVIYGFMHFFRRSMQNLLITAPELLHLKPLAKQIENRIEGCRLTRECLKRDKVGQTGFSHNPFGVEYADGTMIHGRIPQRDGRGVKGQHNPDLIIEEAQDYPDEGWIEVDATVMREVPDFTMHFYGVHRGARGGGFAKRVSGGMFKVHALTAIQRPGWGPEEKKAAIETYGGTNSSDYRRNILGEPGAASSPLFVISRLMASVDQNQDSEYNTRTYMAQHFRWEDLAQVRMELEHVVDLPGALQSNKILVGMDLGLTNSPTVCSIFAEIKHRSKGEHGARNRLALIRRFTLQHFRAKDIRQLAYIIWCWRKDIVGIGMDATGLGFPIFQDIEDDESYPDEFKACVHGWKFNQKIDVVDEYSKNKKEVDPGAAFYFQVPEEESKATRLTVIEATTNYLRDWVDSGYILLPMDNEVVEDLLAENIQRVKDVSRLTGAKKPNRFHILDSFRMASLVERMSETEEIQQRFAGPVLDRVVDPGFF